MQVHVRHLVIGSIALIVGLLAGLAHVYVSNSRTLERSSSTRVG
jgi:hypothetical protein